MLFDDPHKFEDKVHDACEHFEREWKAGPRPSLKKFLDEFERTEHPTLIYLLIRLELHYRRKLNEQPTPEEYETLLSGERETINRAFTDEAKARNEDLNQTETINEKEEPSVEWPGSNHSGLPRSLPANASSAVPENPYLGATITHQPGADFPAGVVSSSSDWVGQTFGDYKVLARLGEGGMGVVYKARKINLDVIVALKMVKAGRQDRERFWDDARAAAQLDHSNIVHIYEVNEHQGHPFFAMGFCDGGSLDDVLNDKFLHPVEAAKLLEWLARAMHVAHEAKIVHRDLKPANILLATADSGICLVTDEGTETFYQPKITDFGLAKRLDKDHGQTSPNVIMGTPSYMSPEQASGKSRDVTRSADVYGLGAILYECLTGGPPFKGPTPMATLKDVERRDPVPVRKVQPKVPRDLETICMKCLEKNPNNRYASALELAEELKRFQRGEPIKARPINLIERLGRAAKRHPAAAIAIFLAGCCSLALLAAVLSSLFAIQKDEATAERCLERGQALAGRGEIAHGMLWMSRGLNRAPWYAKELQHELRLSLAGWGQQVHPLQDVMDYKSAVWTVGFSPDGKTLAYGGINKTIHIQINGKERSLAKTLQSPSKVSALAFSPTEDELATGHFDGTVRIWDLKRLMHVRVISVTQGEPVRGVAFSPDGKYLLTGSEDRRACLWDVVTGKQVGSSLDHPREVWTVAFSPDGKSVLTGCNDRKARVWEVWTEQKDPVSKEAKPTFTFAHNGSVASVAFGPEGKVLTGSLDGTARVWNLNTKNSIVTLPHGEQVWAVAWHTKNNLIVTGCLDGAARIWDVRTGELRGSKLRHQDVVWAVAISPDGQEVLTGSEDHSARVWSLGSGARLAEHPEPVDTLVFSPKDSQILLTGCNDGNVYRWKTDTCKKVGKPLEHNPYDQVTVVRCSRDGTMLLAAGREGRVSLWRTRTGERLQTAAVLLANAVVFPIQAQTFSFPFALEHTGYLALAHTTMKPHLSEVITAAFSPNGAFMATGSRDGTVRLWDARTGLPRRQPLLHGYRVTDLEFSPDSKLLITGSGDESARLWDTATGKQVGKKLPHGSWIYTVNFSPDSKRVVTGGGGKNGFAQQWDVATHKRVGPPMKHRGVVYTATYSPDGKTILTGSGDWTARLWDAQTGEPLGLPCHHEGAVRAVAFHPYGQRFVTGGTDGAVHVWEARTGKLAGTGLPQRGPIRAVAFSPDGQWVAASSSDGIVRLWEPPSPLKGKANHILRTMEVITGMVLDAKGVVDIMGADEWKKRQQELTKMGGSVLPSRQGWGKRSQIMRAEFPRNP